MSLWKKWAIGFLLPSILQSALFALSLWLTFRIVGLAYGSALVIGVAFYALLVVAMNLFCTATRPIAWSRFATGLAIAIHVVAWGEDLNTYFAVSAIAGISFGVLIILSRFWIIRQLDAVMS